MARMKVSGGEAVYHCVARAVAGQHLFGKLEREQLRKQFRDCAAFAGVEVLTFAILANHYHVLVRVPPARPLSDAELVLRVRALLRDEVADELEVALGEQRVDSLEGTKLRLRFCRQMHDISAFMKLVNQWFAIWFNKVHGRFGTLWAERFKSTIVGGTEALQTVAAYIDLNPVRAGICVDPKDYRFCGYGEAVAGMQSARAGICSVIKYKRWRQAHAHYRCLLFGAAERAPERKGRRQAAVDPKLVQAVFRAGGELSLPQLLRCRVRYFSDGVILGAAEFVEEMVRQAKSSGCLDGKRGARAEKLTGLASLRSLRVLRRLRKVPVTEPRL